MDATPLPGTHRCVRHSVLSALDSLGGIKVIFPLFAQLDQPRIFRSGYIDRTGDRNLSQEVWPGGNLDLHIEML